MFMVFKLKFWTKYESSNLKTKVNARLCQKQLYQPMFVILV